MGVPRAVLGCLPSLFQGPVHIGTGCLLSGLDTAQCEALRGLELHDLVLQGHHVRLHGAPGRVFTLVGRLDSWEVGVLPTSLIARCKALGSPEHPSPAPMQL